MRPARKVPATAPERSKAWRGYQKVLVALKPAQAAALKREALRVALESGAARPDAGAIVREALDAWLAKNGKK